MIDYYQLELDDMVIALHNKDETIEKLEQKLKKAKQENANHNFKAKKRRIHINNLKNENDQLREQLKEKNVKLNELRHQRNEANEILDIIEDMYPNTIKAYFKKWGVK